jgi:hypothetical protein
MLNLNQPIIHIQFYQKIYKFDMKFYRKAFLLICKGHQLTKKNQAFNNIVIKFQRINKSGIQLNTLIFEIKLEARFGVLNDGF